MHEFFAIKIAPFSLITLLVFAGVGLWKTDIFTAHGTEWIMVPIGAFVALLVSTLLNKRRRDGWAFFMTSLTIILLSASVFIGMFPRVMISSLGAMNDLTIYNAKIRSLCIKTYDLLCDCYFAFRYRKSNMELLCI